MTAGVSSPPDFSLKLFFVFKKQMLVVHFLSIMVGAVGLEPTTDRL